MATIAQTKARQNNLMIGRLKVAERLFGGLCSIHNDMAIYRLSEDAIDICEKLQTRLKELYEKDKEGG